jgi:RES domain-containing protein
MSEGTDEVRVWRLIRQAYALSVWDGEGSYRYGGRWNSRGQRMVYTSGSLALALLENLAHLEPGDSLPAYLAFSVEFPRSKIERVEIVCPATGPISFPHDLKKTREIGDRWLREGQSPVLEVPSALAPVESNFLLNPEHPDFDLMKFHFGRPFAADQRLGRKVS